MKKFLSLVLALVMTMSLVTISAGAKDFTDADTITYDEAVAVMSAVKVIDGYTDDSFKPTATLTRGAAAKIICNLILGPTTASELPASVAPFKDVPANSTFAGYIAYCAKEGIVGGYADGTFKPGASLTGYAFMKMLLGALGYDAEIEGYNTPGTWSISVAKQALGIGLNAGLREDFNGVKAVTREEACLYAFNTLRATMVDYEAKTTVNVGDATVTVAGSTAKPVYWAEGINHDGNIKRDGFVQFAEQYFTKLEEEDVRDVFGRPSRKWDYKGDEIDTYVNHDLLVETYTEKVTGKDLYTLLGSSTIDNYDLEVFVDGETDANLLGDAYFDASNLLKTNTEKVGETGNGVVTEVYVDSDGKDITIAIINTYLAIATDDYNEKKDEVSFEVYGVDQKTSVKNSKIVGLVKDVDVADPETETLTVSGDDFDIKDVEDDQIVLVTVADGEIQSIANPDALEDVSITKFKKGSYITTGGEDYKYASTALYDNEVLDAYVDNNMKDTTYNVILDQYGYLIGLEIVEDVTEYLFLTGIDGAGSNLTNKTYDANVIFLDGTMETVKINSTKSVKADGTTSMGPAALINTWCTYTTNKDGVYTLTQVADAAATFEATVDGKLVTDKVGQGRVSDDTTITAADIATIDKKHVTTNGIADSTGFKRVYGNDASIYINVEVKKIAAPMDKWSGSADDVAIISDVDSVNTGVQTTSLKAFNAQKVLATNNITGVDKEDTSHGVYTLFNNKGYVIAAIVVGEDDGATTNYAYVTSGNVNYEGYDATASEYTWTRDVVVNGEVVELTEVTDGKAPAIKGMARNNWYEVKYYADGTVRSATKINADDGDATIDAYEFYKKTIAANKFIGQIDNVELSVVAHDTVVLFEDLTAQPYVVSVKGNTLQVDTKTATVSRGFAVAPSAKVILVQDVDVLKDGVVVDTKVMDKIYDYDNGVSGLEKAVKALNDNANFKGYVSAVFEGGVATSVVIYDQTADDLNAGSGAPTTSASVYVNLANPAAVDVVYANSTTAPSAPQALPMVVSALQAEGYTVGTPSLSGSTYTFPVTKVVGGVTVSSTFTWASSINAGKPMTVNGEDVIVKSATWTTIASELGITAVGTHVKVVGQALPVDVTLSTGLVAGAVAEFGYYKISTTNPVVTLNGSADAFVKIGEKIAVVVTVASDPAGTIRDFTVGAGNTNTYSDPGNVTVDSGKYKFDVTLVDATIAENLNISSTIVP